MSLPVCAVRLEATSLEYIDVFWSIPNTQQRTLGYTYQVLRGESPAGPFDPVTEPLTDRFHIRDYIAPRKMAWRNLYYVVRLRSGEDSTESEPVALRARPPLDALEMIRLNSLLFREYTGRPVLIYQTRTFGERCSNCYDNTTQRRLLANCRNCYGTTYARGYHYPVYAYVQISPETRAPTPTDTIQTQQALTQARLSIYPLVKQGDLFIEREGTRWRVQSVQLTERLRAPVQQIVSITRVPEGDVEYNLPAVWDNIETSPRSFTANTGVQ
jgi:hypothetical protein